MNTMGQRPDVLQRRPVLLYGGGLNVSEQPFIMNIRCDLRANRCALLTMGSKRMRRTQSTVTAYLASPNYMLSVQLVIMSDHMFTNDDEQCSRCGMLVYVNLCLVPDTNWLTFHDREMLHMLVANLVGCLPRNS